MHRPTERARFRTRRPAGFGGRGGRSAFTLFELLLVLGILAIIAGTAWPLASWWYRDSVIRQAAADVRVVLDRTRVKAIESGLPYEFRFEPGGRRFVSLPAEIPLSTLDQSGSVGAPTTTATTPATGDATKPTVEYVYGELPEGLTFSLMSPAAFFPTQVNPELYGQLEDADVIRETSWSAPLLYRPDGTTEDDRIEIVDEEKRALALEIRGLTAGIRTSDLHLEGR